MLYSFVNAKLRDQYHSLEAFCEDFGADPEEIKGKLEAAGFAYDEELNQFR